MGLIDLIFPKVCLSCKKDGKYICAKCINRVHFSKPICINCEKNSIDGFTHIKCKKTLSLDGVISIWSYEKVIRHAITKLKYRFVREIADELAAYAVYYLKNKTTALGKDAVIAPVPLHRFRKNWRGFNQSEMLGKLVAKRLGWNYIPDLLYRKKTSVPQVELSGKSRKNNVKGVFRFNNIFEHLAKSDRQIILFDDVLTTGSTIKEAAKVLKRKEFSNVWGLTIAR